MVTMEVKLLIPSVYCDTDIQRYIHITGYRAGVLLRYYRTGMQRAVLPLPPAPAPLKKTL